jgi:cytochrome c oxidase subunit IV
VVWGAGGDALPSAVFLTSGVIATVVAFSAEVGRAFVQASAYGEEDRHLLRPPVAYLLPSALAWMVDVALWLAGTALVARSRWLAGGLLLVAGLVVAVWGWKRWHRLSRRWFVIVPVGVVLHDHLVLAETLMVKRTELDRLRLAPAGTDAADFTGPTTGHAIELLTNEPVTAIVAATPAEPRGKAIHLTGCIVAPTRPGRLLAAAQARRLPVG